MKQSFREKYGPWALITGGASGIGAEFARRLAERGLNIALLDIQEELMRRRADELRQSRGVAVREIIADLALPGFMDLVRPAVADLEIGLLINDAAWGSVGEFMKTDIDTMIRTVETNCRAPMVLARELGPAMLERGRGGIIFLSSSSATQGTPVIANYAATKAYNLILAEALWDELRPYGVDVLGLCPGATDTPAFRSSGAVIENVPGMPFMQTGRVVDEALAALGRRPGIIAGRVNRVAAFVMTRLLPRHAAISYTGKNLRKLYPGE